MVRFGCVLLLAVVGLGADLARAAEQLDWCAPLVYRPDARWYRTNPCEPWWPDDEIARRADYVLDGFLNPSNSWSTPDHATCWGSATMESSGAYHQRLRTAAAAYGRTLRIIYFSRLDLVDHHTAATPGFEADYLVDAGESWRNVTDFFQRDTTPPCACGCEWNDALGPAFVNAPPGQRMRDLIDAVSSPGTYQTKIFYGSRVSSGGSLAGAPRKFFGLAAIADQTNADYRAWRIGHMQDAITVGNYDAVFLNHKFNQYLPSRPPPYWGGSLAPDVATYMTVDDLAQWSSPAADYGYSDYVTGWEAFADDLEAAGIPFAIELSPFVWRGEYDDPATSEIDEGAVLRDVARRARWVLMERFPPQFSDAQFAAVVADVEGPGVATVVPYNLSCGDGSPPGRTPPALTAGLTFAPDAAAQSQFAGTALRVVVGGTSTGPWDAELWCHCTTPSCGTPDATTTGRTGSDWLPPLDLCNGAYQAAALGTRSPRVAVHRAGLTATSQRQVTICAAACANGRDDDRDGFADYPADPGCESPGDLDEISPALRCDDGLDNDGDGETDSPSDPQCTTPMHSPEARKPCGLGAELLLPLAFLGLFRFGRRGRRRE